MTKRRFPPPAGDFEIGRGRPPKETRFAKGQSGNPDGRPRGAGRTKPSQIEKLIDRGIMMNVDGKRKRVSVTDFTAAKLVQQANSGSIPALRELNRMSDSVKAAKRLAAEKDGASQVSFIVRGLEDSAREALLLLNLAVETKTEPQLTLAVVAFGVQHLGRALTAPEEKLLSCACAEFSAWYATRRN